MPYGAGHGVSAAVFEEVPPPYDGDHAALGGSSCRGTTSGRAVSPRRSTDLRVPICGLVSGRGPSFLR
jgi:hypothetical protein